MGELAKAKTIKMADLGTVISKQFGVGFKQMGFEEKSVQKFLEARVGSKIKCDGTTLTLL